MRLLFSPQTVHSKKYLILDKFKQIYGDLEMKKEHTGAFPLMHNSSNSKIELSNSEKGEII